VSGPAWTRLNDTVAADEEEDSSDSSQPQSTHKNPPEHLDGYSSLFGRANRNKFLDYRDYVSSPPHGQSSTPYHAPPAAVVPPYNLAAVIAAVMQAQTEAATANNANMIAFTTATAQALATSAGGDKASKLTPAKKLILQACTGDGDSPIFIPPPVFASLATEGGTSDAIGLTLRRMLQPDGLRSSHKTQLYVSPQLVQTIKTFNFLASGDKSYLNCTRGITIFAVPWRSYESMTEEAAEEEYYQQLTV
jgi:hypothetical protein